MSATVAHILACLDAAYPFAWADTHDRVGLQAGDPEAPVSTILVALEAGLTVVAEARAQAAQLLLTHHPLLYQAAADLREDRAQGALLAAVVRARLSVIACHTNLDLAPKGLNDYLARELGLIDPEVLAPVRQDAWVKLAVFVPAGYEPRVRAALMDDRVGVIGNYEHCSFAARGHGTYRPLAGAKPFRGEAAELTRVEESRLEVLMPESLVHAALARLRAAHPYEEVACDLYPLANQGVSMGYGRVGNWTVSLSWEEVVSRVKQVFAVSGVRVWGRPPARVNRAAVCGGSGGDLIGQTQDKGAQVYITGEVRHHQVIPAREQEFAIIEVGHFASEVAFMPAWAEQVAQMLKERQLEVQVRVAASATAPFRIT